MFLFSVVIPTTTTTAAPLTTRRSARDLRLGSSGGSLSSSSSTTIIVSENMPLQLGRQHRRMHSARGRMNILVDTNIKIKEDKEIDQVNVIKHTCTSSSTFSESNSTPKTSTVGITTQPKKRPSTNRTNSCYLPTMENLPLQIGQRSLSHSRSLSLRQFNV